MRMENGVTMRISKFFLRFSKKVNIVLIILFTLLLAYFIPFVYTGQPPITFISSKPYYTYTKNLCIQSGELSADDIKKLSRFHWVEKLYIWPVQIYDISFLNSMNNLKELTIGGLQSEIEDWSPINNCPNLTSVFAWNVGLTDLEPFKNLTELKRLDLQENDICDITGIENLTSLESISLWGDELLDISSIKYASKLKQVKILSTGLTDISPIGSLSNLESLILNGCSNIRDVSALQNCKSLIFLDISNTSIEDYSELLLNSNIQIQTSNGNLDSLNVVK